MESAKDCEIELCKEILAYNNIDKVPMLCEKLIAYRTAIRKECADKIIAWLFPEDCLADIYPDSELEKKIKTNCKEIRALIVGVNEND